MNVLVNVGNDTTCLIEREETSEPGLQFQEAENNVGVVENTK